MKTLAFTLSTLSLVALAACSTAEEADTSGNADEFAARINGGEAAPQVNATVAPTVVPPRENAAEGAFAPGTATDPESATCSANKMGPFIGKVADEATRLDVMNAAAGAAEVRFIAPGGDYIRPDPTNPRLNIMIDKQGIIRDARCG